MLGAETSPEHTRLALDTGGNGLQFNFGLNRSCNLTSHCGERCILNVVLPDSLPMPESLQETALLEVLDAGRLTRHLTFCEKEPLLSPRILRLALSQYHARSPDKRPQSIGCISNGLLLPQNYDWLEVTPLDWCLVSLDGMPTSHLRGSGLWEPAFRNLLELRQRGGARIVGVNTVVTNANADSVIALGRLLSEKGIDYWGLGAYMHMNNAQRMVSSLTSHEIADTVMRIAATFDDAPLPIVCELDAHSFSAITGTDPEDTPDAPWRIDHRVRGNVFVATVNAHKFIRLRFDGQIIDKSQLLTVDVKDGRYGKYRPGRIRELLQAVAQTPLIEGAVA